MHRRKLRITKWDMAVIAGVLALAALVLVLFLPGQDGSAAYAEIWQDGRLVKRVLLTVDQEFTVAGAYSNTVTVRDGRIAVTASNCPGEDCVSCGWLDRMGRSIVCLPNGLEIRVVAADGVDLVVG